MYVYIPTCTHAISQISSMVARVHAVADVCICEALFCEVGSKMHTYIWQLLVCFLTRKVTSPKGSTQHKDVCVYIYVYIYILIVNIYYYIYIIINMFVQFLNVFVRDTYGGDPRRTLGGPRAPAEPRGGPTGCSAPGL